jgi:serine phosphatase RsbU (regulator of sigma subunit)
VPAVELAATYRAGLDEARIGGDWYDGFVLPDGRLGTVVGDVMGKGLAAAAGMARMRAAVRALAFTDPSPRAVLTGLDRVFTATEEDDQITTMAYLVLDPATGRLVAGDAGHLPFLRVPVSGAAEFVDVGRSATPLGVAEPRIETELQLTPGDVVVAYTDGLVERRDQGIDEGMAELASIVAAHLRDEPDLPVRQLVARVAVPRAIEGRHADDVTVLALRWLGPATA